MRLGLILLAVAGLAGPAAAHALLTGAVPRVGSTIATPPAEVEITYSEGVEPSFSSIEVQDAAGRHVDSGDVHLSPADPKQLVVGLQAIPPGTYTVNWHVTSTDTHKTQGSFVFTVSP